MYPEMWQTSVESTTSEIKRIVPVSAAEMKRYVRFEWERRSKYADYVPGKSVGKTV